MADVIEILETYCLELPYSQVVHFHSVTEDSGSYLIVRLVTSNTSASPSTPRPRS